MDSERFDRLAKALVGMGSRRGMLGGLLGATLLGLIGAQDVEAKPKKPKKPKKRKKPKKPKLKPNPTPPPGLPMQQSVAIVNFAFTPNPVTIGVGSTITWTNQDNDNHTATGVNSDLLDSGTIPPDGSFSQTFTQAGQIEYFCDFHPDMTGTIIVI